VVKRFPGTDYAQDAQFKIDFIKEHIACQEISLAKYYLKSKKYIAALDRLSVLVRDYPKSVLIPEALYRIVECQISLGLCDAAQKTAAMLSYNFPKDMWTGMAKDLLCLHTGTRPAIVSVSPASPQKKIPAQSSDSNSKPKTPASSLRLPTSEETFKESQMPVTPSVLEKPPAPR
jgi:outer membrane protein assembly factor BamD